MQALTHAEITEERSQAPRRSWRAVLSVLLAAVLLLASLHHLTCLGEAEASGASAASAVLSVSLPDSAPTGADQCLPGHCHCVCHASSQASTEHVSSSIDFVPPAYGIGMDHLPRLMAGLPPFKPPRA
jgi:hypothetical protein